MIWSPISAYSNEENTIDFQYPILFTNELYKNKFNMPESQNLHSFFNNNNTNNNSNNSKINPIPGNLSKILS